MVHFDPAAIEAAGTVILAAETGVAMALGKKSAEKTAAAAPTPVNVTVNGIGRDDFLLGMLILAGAMPRDLTSGGCFRLLVTKLLVTTWAG